MMVFVGEGKHFPNHQVVYKSGIGVAFDDSDVVDDIVCVKSLSLTGRKAGVFVEKCTKGLYELQPDEKCASSKAPEHLCERIFK